MLPFGKAVMKRVGAYAEAELSSVSEILCSRIAHLVTTIWQLVTLSR